MNIDANLFSLASLGIVVSSFAGAVLGLHVKNRVPGLRFRDSARAMVYLTKYEAALEYHGLRAASFALAWTSSGPTSPSRPPTVE